MAIGAVVARILTQYSDKGSKQAQKDLMKLGKSFDAYAKKASRAVGLVAVASAAAAVKIGKDSVMAASDVSQQFGALDAVFKENSKQLKDFSKTMVEYGLSTADSARYSALLGTQLTGLGLSQQDAIERTKTLQILAADLAATYGGTTADAVAALSSTFKGEYNPIERYGVAIRKSDITARVAAKGLKGLTGEALKAAEAQAAYELILSKTTAAQGQSGREFNTLAAQLQRLNASYTNIQASLGEALLPVVQEFSAYLLKDVVPGIQKWVDLNRGQLAESLKNAAKLAGQFLKYAGQIAQWATNNIGVVKAIAAAIATIFVVNKLATFVSSISTMVTALKGLKVQADLTNASTSKIGLLGKIGIGAAVATVAIPGFDAYNNAVKKQLDQTKDLEKLERQLFTAQIRRDPYSQTMIKRRIEALKQEIALTEKLKTQLDKFVSKGTVPYKIGLLTPAEHKAAQKALEQQAALEKVAADQAAKALQESIVATDKDAKAKALLLKAQKALAQFNVKAKTEDDPIQLEAARLNLVKQGNLAEAARLSVISKNLEAQLQANKALTRYTDLLAVLADSKISNEEISILSKKWGMTVEATQSYIQTLLAVSDQKISPDEVVNLAKAWGGSQEQAQRYLDFFNYLNDGKLSDAEINKLQTKWGLTSKEVKIYADLITKASDYVLSDKEITDLGTNWGLTTKEVLEYVKKLGQPVTFSGTLVDPATQAELGWKNALDALLAYQAALSGKGYTSETTGNNRASAGAVKEAEDAVKAAEEAIKAADAASAAVDAAIKSADEILAKVYGADKVPGLLAAQESRSTVAQSADAARAAAFERQREQSAIKAEALEQRFGGTAFTASSTLNNAQSIGTPFGQAGSTNVTVNVQGSVTSEQDLVQAVRNGLLAGQYNGKQILLQAI